MQENFFPFHAYVSWHCAQRQKCNQDSIYENFHLELRQYKNDSIHLKKNPILEMPLFFITYTAREKARQCQNWILVWTEWSNFYIVLAFIFTVFSIWTLEPWNELGISFLSVLFFSRACCLKRHSQKTQWEWRHFKLIAQTRRGGVGGWKSKRHSRSLHPRYHIFTSAFIFGNFW